MTPPAPANPRRLRCAGHSPPNSRPGSPPPIPVTTLPRARRQRTTHQGQRTPRMASSVVAGPHPDDQELGMGGTIARPARQGHTVHLTDMTNGEPTPFGSVETRAREAA